MWCHSGSRKDQKKIDQVAKIDRYLFDQFALFLDRMKQVKEGDSNLLDNSMILHGSAISDVMRQAHHDLPVLVAGNGAGTVKSGRVMEFEKETPLNNLFLGMGDCMGAEIKELGDSNGRIRLS